MPTLLLKSPNILIVDDEIQNLNQMKEWLKHRHVTLFQARSGEQALKILSEFTIHAVVTDWVLPGLSGLDLVKSLRETKFKGPLLVFTGSMIDSQHLQMAFDAGANDYLRKPLNDVEFNARLDKSLQLFAHQYALETLNRSQNQLMALMTDSLGLEIQRLDQAQTLLDKGGSNQQIEDFRRESTLALKIHFHKLMNWSRYRLAIQHTEIQRFEARQMLKSVESQTGPDSWRLRIKGGGDLWVLSNQEFLQRVLLQLISNGFVHTLEEVTVRCSQIGQHIRFEVLDRGRLSEGQLDRLGMDQGCGLGLRICHDLLALLGSRLYTRPRRLQGSCFYFDLPGTL